MAIASSKKKNTKVLNQLLDSSIRKKKINGNQETINVCKWNSEVDHPVWTNDDHEKVGHNPIVLRIK